MIEYRVVSAKSYIPAILGSEQKGSVKLEFFPQSRNELSIELTKKDKEWVWNQHDEDGWMFYPDRLCFDDIDSAYAHIKMFKEIADYGRQIHPYLPM